MDKDEDPRLATRHYDLLVACAIAWQMKDLAEVKQDTNYQQSDYEPTSQFETSNRTTAFFEIKGNLYEKL
jgi:hypothetical protein